jgi:hypothetical protein
LPRHDKDGDGKKEEFKGREEPCHEVEDGTRFGGQRQEWVIIGRGGKKEAEQYDSREKTGDGEDR